jgi:hypothetical protein
MRLLTLLILAAISLPGASMTGQLLVQVRPEATMTLQGDQAVQVRIRLASGSQGNLWVADSCDRIPAAAYVISRSDAYLLPLSEIPGTGAGLCLVSSDGAIRVSLSLTPGARR